MTIRVENLPRQKLNLAQIYYPPDIMIPLELKLLNCLAENYLAEYFAFMFSILQLSTS
jgi:hypothetical protein